MATPRYAAIKMLELLSKSLRHNPGGRKGDLRTLDGCTALLNTTMNECNPEKVDAFCVKLECQISNRWWWDRSVFILSIGIIVILCFVHLRDCRDLPELACIPPEA